jgi:excisionase family DNA binding protein
VDDNDLMNAGELARWLRVDVRTVYRYIHTANLPYRRVGRQYRFLRREVEAWLRTEGWCRLRCHQ